MIEEIKNYAPPTEKQIEFAEAIARCLDLDLPETKTKQAYMEFISEWAQDYYAYRHEK